MNWQEKRKIKREARRERDKSYYEHRRKNQKKGNNWVVWLFLGIGLLSVLANILAEMMKNHQY